MKIRTFLPSSFYVRPFGRAAALCAILISARLAEAQSSPESDVMRPAMGAAWDDEDQPQLAAFNRWAREFTRADAGPRAPLASSARTVADGVRLARERQASLLTLAHADPARALAASVPVAVRAKLPASIVSELETPFSAVGDFNSYCELRAIGGPRVKPSRYDVRFGGHVYPANVYGRHAGMTCKQNVFLHGFLIGGEAVLDDNVLRVLPKDEAALDLRAPHDLSSPAAAGSATASSSSLPVLAEAGGTLYRFASDTHVRRAEAALRLIESHRTPETSDAAEPAALESSSGDSLAPDSAFTVGTKKVLVIRVDFSDFAGDPSFRGSTTGTVAQVQNIADNQVKPYYVRSSYNLTSLTTTVSSKVYRLPRTASDYATADDNDGLHSDAETLAGADYDVSSYDRVAVLFSFLGDLSGSQITYGGLAQVGGRNLWVNGEFDFRVVAHELGHTYGLIHGNLWKVSDGNALSLNGSSQEYGDDYDTMGANFANSQACDFNVWYKTQLDWVPLSKVKRVTTGGTYRVSRFDGGSAAGANLALEVVRDGTRNYWVSVRRSFTGNSTMTHGVYVTWGGNANYLNDNLLDLRTPGASPSSGGNSDVDAALPTGQALADTAAGIGISAIAEGGTAPDEYEDVTIELNTQGTAPVVTSSATASGTVGTAFTYQITATNSPTSYGASGLPTGFSVNTSTGAITGTPGEDGTFSVVVSAFNGGGPGSKTVTLTIARSPNAPTITSFSPQSGAVGSTVTITGTHFLGLQYIRFSGNAYAAGNFSDTSITTTVPSGAVTGPITVHTSNGSVSTASDFTITSANAPSITSATTLTARVGEAFTYQITATNSPMSFGVGGLFKGVTVDKQTGLISGTPTGTGTHSLDLRATNSAGTGHQTLTLTVKIPQPAITSAGTATAYVNKPFSYQIAATNNPTSYGVGGLFGGISVNQQTGVISGTPTGAGTHTLDLRAVNGGGTGHKNLVVTVESIPTVNSAATFTAHVGKAFTYQITATQNPTSFGVGGLFSGVTVNQQTGLISGTPTAKGTHALDLRAINGAGTGHETLTLTVAP